MWTDATFVTGEVEVGAWLEARLTGQLGFVTGTAPAGFPAYARILHPVAMADGIAASWAQVASETGGRLHPAVQWHSLIGASDPFNPESPRWPHGGPDCGNLAVPVLRATCNILADHTSTPDDCFFAIWDGWGALNGGSARVTVFDGGSTATESLPRRFTDEEWALPRLRLPHRDYVLARGPLSAMDELAHYEREQFTGTQSPSIFWPEDRAWCVATEIDFDSTIVAGGEEAVDAILSCPDVEALPISADQSLRYDADKLNQ